MLIYNDCLFPSSYSGWRAIASHFTKLNYIEWFTAGLSINLCDRGVTGEVGNIHDLISGSLSIIKSDSRHD